MTTSNILLVKTDFIRHLISEHCKVHGLKKSAIAARAGISREMLYKFETGASDIGVSKLIAILSELGLRIELVPDIEALPADHRRRKSAKQQAFLASGDSEAISGIAQGARIRSARIPALGSDW